MTTDTHIILYRTISYRELATLMCDGIVFGKYDLSKEKQSTSNEKDVVSFYNTPFKWDFRGHEFFITIKAPTHDPNFIKTGYGTYKMSDKCYDTNVWTGKTGKCVKTFTEFYLPYYTKDMLIDISPIRPSHIR